jgi:hypothetical protein
VAVDDDTDCVEHLWQLAGVALIPGNGGTDYVCARSNCGAVLYVGPDDPMPHTV